MTEPETAVSPIHLGGSLIRFPKPPPVEPCPATTTAVLMMVGAPAEVRCGQRKGHAGRHRTSIEWGQPHIGGSGP